MTSQARGDAHMSSSIRVLEEKHMLSALIYLAGNDGCTKTELYRAVSTNPRMPEKLSSLERAGLLTMDTDAGSNTTRIHLTETGRRVSECLIEADGIMSRTM